MAKLSLTQIEEELKKIEYISSKERVHILEELEKHIDFGGVDQQEFLEAIADLRAEFKISEVDEKYLKQIVEDMK